MGKPQNVGSVFEIIDMRDSEPENFEGVRFALPYGDKTFDVRLANHDLDTLLEASKFYILFDRHLMVELPNPELPLVASVDQRSVIKDDESAGWDIEMDVVIRPISTVYGKAGRLAVVGVRQDEGHYWSKVVYEEIPPFTHRLVSETKLAPVA